MRNIKSGIAFCQFSSWFFQFTNEGLAEQEDLRNNTVK